MWGRDDKKDPPQWQGEPDAKNVWCLNLNLDMLKKVGYSPNGNGNDLIDPNDLPKVHLKSALAINHACASMTL